MADPDEFFLTGILVFLIIPILGMLCGSLRSIYSRRQLKNYRENYGLKFASSVLFGFILICLDPFFWIGNLTSITIIISLYQFISLQRLIYSVPLWYLFLYFCSRIGFDHFFGRSPPVPYLDIEDPTIKKGYQKIYKVLEYNLNMPLGKLKHRWAMPAGKFMSCYLWDSAFISLIWKYWDIDVAYEILQPLLDNQSNDGQVPHFVSFFHKSDKTQPPLIAWAISNLELKPKNLEIAYQKLKNYNNWLYQNRRLENGLFFWRHSYESGIDNSPRFTNRSEKEKYDLTSRAVIDLNSYMVLQNQSLIKIASKLKDSSDLDYEKDILEFQKKNEELIRLIQENLWNEEEGLYFDYDFSEKSQIKINTIASFIPLIAGIPTDNQAKRLIEHLENPKEYNTLIPLPTVALSDPNFEKDTWRGPVWLNTAYLVIKGLEKYNAYKLSGELAYRLIKGVFQTWWNVGSFYEFYDPERFDLDELTRKKGNFFKLITLGNKPVKRFIGWTGLVNTLLIESIIGYNLIEQSIQPRLPKELKGHSILLKLLANSKELRIVYNSEQDISISFTDFNTTTLNINKKCQLYQKVFLHE